MSDVVIEDYEAGVEEVEAGELNRRHKLLMQELVEARKESETQAERHRLLMQELVEAKKEIERLKDSKSEPSEPRRPTDFNIASHVGRSNLLQRRLLDQKRNESGMRSSSETNFANDVVVHVEKDYLINALLTTNDRDHMGHKFMLTQHIVEREAQDGSSIVYWKFQKDKKNFDALVQLRVLSEQEEEIRHQAHSFKGTAILEMNSVDESDLTADLDLILEQANSNRAFTTRLVLDVGLISIRPLSFGQSLLAMSANVYFEGSSAAHAPGPVFDNISKYIAERFSDEIGVDEKKRQAFLANEVPSAPALTRSEKDLIDRSLLYEAELAHAPRVAGSVADNVEKFLFWDNKTGSYWGKTVAKVDCNYLQLFVKLWVVNTHERAKEFKRDNGNLPRYAFENIDGTRSLQYATSVKFPGTFQNRLFDSWITWDLREVDGRRQALIAMAPMSEYKGTRKRIPDSEKLIEATSKAIWIISEVTENTCLWRRCQQVDLKTGVLPKKVLGYLATNQLDWTNEIQEFFSRNGKKVDGEVQKQLVENIIRNRGKPIPEDQKPLWLRCNSLKGTNESEWDPLKPGPKNPDVKMWIKFPKVAQGRRKSIVKDAKKKSGQERVATGKAIGYVDCTAEKLCAWMMDYNSNERVRVNKALGHPARLCWEYKERGLDDICCATIKKMPFPLHNREFVARQFYHHAEDGTISVCVEGISDVIDYGKKMRIVRAFTRSLFQMKNVPSKGKSDRCEVTLLQYLDAGGNLPIWLINQSVPKALGTIQEAINELRQDEKVDKEELRAISKHLRTEGLKQVYSPEELALIGRVKARFGNLSEHSDGYTYKRLDSPDPFVKMMTWMDNSSESNDAIIGRATGVIDATLEDVAAFEMARMSRDRLREHRDFGGLERSEKHLNDHTTIFYSSLDLKTPTVKEREFLNKIVWKYEDEDTLIVCFESYEDPEEYPVKYLRANSTAKIVYKRLPELDNIPQTSMIYTVQVDMKGLIPKFIFNTRAVTFLSFVSNVRKLFSKSLRVDARWRNKYITTFQLAKVGGDGAKDALNLFDNMFNKTAASQRPRTSFPLANNWVRLDKASGRGWGTTTINVNATVEEVAAFIWDFASRSNYGISKDLSREVNSKNAAEGGDCLKQCVKRRIELRNVKKHNKLLAKERVFCNTMTLYTPDDESIIILLKPLFSDSPGSSFMANTNRALAGQMTVAYKLVRRGLKKTKLQVALELNFNARMSVIHKVPHYLVKSTVEKQLNDVAEISIYFQRLMPLSDYGLAEGEALGYDLMWNTGSSKKRVRRIRIVAKESLALRELIEGEDGYPWFPLLLETATKGKLALNYSVHTKLECIVDAEAILLGKNLVPALKARKTAESGVNQWKDSNRPVMQLLDKHKWLEATFVVVSRSIVKAATWGVIWRVGVGAVFSVADLATDAYLAYDYYVSGEEFYVFFLYTITCIATTMVIQAAIVTMQNRKYGLRRTLWELLFVVVGMKAPWDAYKVASGKEKDPEMLMDPMMELTANKCAELFGESIPGAIVQISAILAKGPRNAHWMALLSLFVSAVTSGFTATQISYDFDTDPYNRSIKPGFYGYVPDVAAKRTSLFITMIGLSATVLLMKTTAVVLFFTVEPYFLALYLGIDMFIFLLVKIYRDDFIYWLPIEGFKKYPIALLMRVLIKVVTDFTGVVQFRHPNEVGGLYWTFSYVLNMTSLLYSIYLYNNSSETVDAGILWTLGISLVSSSVILFSIFLLTIQKKYVATFFSVQTGPQSTVEQFMTAPTDAIRAGGIFRLSYHHWAKIENGVALWVRSNWDDWNENRPAWFTDEMRALIPADMVPTDADRRRILSLHEMKDAGEDMRRQLSMGRRNSGVGMLERFGFISSSGRTSVAPAPELPAFRGGGTRGSTRGSTRGTTRFKIAEALLGLTSGRGGLSISFGGRARGGDDDDDDNFSDDHSSHRWGDDAIQSMRSSLGH